MRNKADQDQVSRAIDEGRIYYGPNINEAQLVTRNLINELWDKKFPLLKRTGDLDWSKNCADYATGKDASKIHHGDINATKKWLRENCDLIEKSNHLTKESLAAIIKDLPKGEYIVNGASHFIKLEVMEGFIRVSEKDGESAVYTALCNPEEAADVLLLSFEYECNFYKKKSFTSIPGENRAA